MLSRWERILDMVGLLLLFYLALPTRAGSPQQHMPITVGPFCLTHPVNFPCGRKPLTTWPPKPLSPKPLLLPVRGETPKHTLTGSKSSNPTKSSILSHLDSTGHSASLNDFKIISCCSSPDELLIRESLLINKLKPSLNLQGSSVPLLLL